MNLKRAALLAGLLFLSSLFLNAGWYSKRPGESFDAVPLGVNEAPAFGKSFSDTWRIAYDLTSVAPAADELQRLKTFRPFTGLTDPEAIAEFSVVRRSVLDSINVLSLDDPRIGDGLLQLYNNRRISIASGRRSAVELRRDSSGGYGDEAINVYDYPCGPDPVKVYDRDFLKLTLRLGHVGRTMLKPAYPGPEPVTLVQQAQWALQNQIIESWGLTGTIVRIDALLGVMESISNNLALPANAAGSAWFIGNAILREPGLTSTQRRDLSLDVWGLGVAEKIEVEHELDYRNTYREGLEYYISGQIPAGTAYNEWMKKTAWFNYRDYYPTGEFRYVVGRGGRGDWTLLPSIQYTGDSTFYQTGIRANGTRQDVSWSLSLDYVSGALRWKDKGMFAGDDQTAQEGVLRGYLDTDDDGILDQASGREILRYADWFGGVSLERSRSNYYAYALKTGQLFRLVGSDADGFPTGRQALGTISSRTDTLDFDVARDETWAYGWSDRNMFVSEYWKTSISRWDPNTSLFVNYRVGTDFKETGVNAALAGSLEPGTTIIYATTTPGWTCTAYRWDGETKVPLDSAQADPNGHMIFHLEDPLEPGERIIVGNMLAGWWSPTYTVPDDNSPRLFQPRLLAGKLLQIEAFGEARYPLTYYRSPDLVNWSEDSTGMFNRFGRSFLTHEINSMSVFGVARHALNINAAVDYYTVVPGVMSEYYPSFNDRFGLDATFEVVNPPNISTDRYQFFGKGYYKNMALTEALSFNIDYRFSSGGQTSSTVASSITINYRDLANPPVERGTNGVDYAVVRCLVLGGLNYPMYQFRCTHSQFDVCTQAHWHSFGQVFPLEFPNLGISDPNPGSCGYGIVESVPQAVVRVPVEDFEDFKFLHVPPL